MIDTVHLTLLVGPTIALPAPRPVIDAFRGAQVTTSAGSRSGFQLTFALSRTSLLQTTMLPAGYFNPGMRVILVATVGGLPHVVVDGLITRQEAGIADALGQSTLTVTGEDISIAMDLDKRRGMIQPPGPAAAKVALTVLKYAQYGIVPLPIPELFPNIVVPTQRIEMSEGTDLEYVTKLATDNGFVFYVEPGPVPGMNVAYWGPEVRIGLPQPALSVDFEGATTVSALNFSFDGLQRTRYTTSVQEPFTKMSIPIPLPDIDPLRPPLALLGAPALKTEQLDGSAKLSATEALAQAVARASASAEAVTAQGQLDVAQYGHVLKARHLVGVRGAGLSYDGMYYVKSVTHDIKPGSYTQSFTLTRSGTVPLTPVVLP